MPLHPLFIGSEIYRASSYGPRHPLSIPRVSTTIDLCRAMGWLPDHAYRDSPMATPDELARFHEPAYIQAVMDAERDQALDAERARRYNIGGVENPIFPEIFRRPATAAGGCLLAAELLGEGGVVYSPASGTHHGRPARASGFCYFNDPVIGLLALLDRGLGPILYIDLDAHHGDGVEDAFANDARVFTLSVHEARRWPFTGRLEDRRGGTALNLPVPAGFNDDELALVRDRVILPTLDRLRPPTVVVQCGADAVEDDPLSRLALSNRALWDTVAAIRSASARLLVMGGGGYNPWSVGRCWAGVWATLNGIDPGGPVTARAEAVLRELQWNRRLKAPPPECWFTSLADPPRPGPVRPEVRDLVEAALRA